MKRALVIGLILFVLFGFSSVVSGQMTFFLIDNFEDGDLSRNPEWWPFDDISPSIVKNVKPTKIDFVAESCGEYSMQIKGNAAQWYVGGLGANVAIDASEFTRLQFDVYGNEKGKGKLKIELYEDDNNNNNIEQDKNKGWAPKFDDIWATEIAIQGKGFTRYSIPFSAFQDGNPGVGNGKWDPDQKNGSGGLLKVQLIAIADSEKGSADFRIDNIILTY
ncbi:MAG: hypothetical protein ABIA63_05470 [bacterium]